MFLSDEKFSGSRPILSLYQAKKVQDYFTSNKITRVAFTQRSKMLQGGSKEDLMDERIFCSFALPSDCRCPDVASFNSVVAALGKGGTWFAIPAILNQMKDWGM